MKILLFILSLAPTLYEAWTDRAGERKKDKRSDLILLVAYSVLLVGASWRWLGYNPLAMLLLLLVIRFAIFDYLVHWFLKRYSENHHHINIWSYTGKSTHWHDQLAAKVPWKIRLIVRVVVFALAVWLYLAIR